MKPKPVAPLD